MDGTPSCPLPLVPQHDANDPVPMAQAWLDPALIVVNDVSAITCTGDSCVAWPYCAQPQGYETMHVCPPAPSPSWPSPFSPQHHDSPHAVRAQVNCDPAEIDWKAVEELTATGADETAVVPSPSWPDPFDPQQYAFPAVVTPQVWSAPAPIDCHW